MRSAAIAVFAAAGWVSGAQTFDPNMPASVPAASGKVTDAATLRYIDTKLGTGPVAAPGQEYTVHYTGWLRDGTKFDSSDRQGPAEVRAGPPPGDCRLGDGLRGNEGGRDAPAVHPLSTGLRRARARPHPAQGRIGLRRRAAGGKGRGAAIGRGRSAAAVQRAARARDGAGAGGSGGEVRAGGRPRECVRSGSLPAHRSGQPPDDQHRDGRGSGSADERDRREFGGRKGARQPRRRFSTNCA